MFLKNFAFAGQACNQQEKVFALANQALIDRFEDGAGALYPVGVWIAEGQKMTGLKTEMEGLIDTGSILVADTLDDLAATTGMDPVLLEETLQRYNGFCANGNDEDFLKPAEVLVAIDSGPYYAFDCQNGFFATVGGLKVTADTEVLNTEGEIIPGLFAGGCDTGGFFGDTYDVGIAGGSCAGWAINSGCIAAEQAKAYLG
jgi:fumarate reductase flavoprotein subunit